MTDDWETSLGIILKEEGGNDDDKRDPGGRTSRGIIQREWNVFRETHPNRPQDVWQAAQSDIDLIYHDNYWEPYCDSLPAGVDLFFFNTSVNSGRTQAVRELQRACGVAADGMMGMITLNAVNNADPKVLVAAMADQRRAFYKQLKTFKTFGKGWLARTDRVEQASLAMAQKNPVNHPVVDTLPNQPDVTVSAKAAVDDVKTPLVSPEVGGAVTAGLGSIIGTLNQFKDQLQSFAGTFNWVNYVLVTITVLTLVYTIMAKLQKDKAQAVI